MEDIVKITEMLHSRISKLELRSGNFQPKITCYMGKQLRPVVVDDTEYSLVGDGDDGVIIKANRETHPDGEVVAFKIFKCEQGVDEYSNVKREVVRDQALREFNALKIIKNHPNFLKLYSTELDTCELKDANGHYKECYAIQLNYITNLTYMERSFSLLGIQYDIASGNVTINYDHRNQLVKYVLTQTFSMISYLMELGIEHRDVDSCNFMMKLPELTPYLFDFSRSSLPHHPGLEDTADPDEISTLLGNELQELNAQKRNRTIASRMEILRYKIRQYKSPVQYYSKMLPDSGRITDSFMCKYWIDKALQKHISSNQWVVGETRDDIDKKNRKENEIIDDFVYHAWIKGTPENVHIESGKLARPFDALFSLSATFAILGFTKACSREKKESISEILARPRQLIHSAQFNEYISGFASSPTKLLMTTEEADAKVESMGLSRFVLLTLRNNYEDSKSNYGVIMGMFRKHSYNSTNFYYYLTHDLEFLEDEAKKIVEFAQIEYDRGTTHE